MKKIEDSRKPLLTEDWDTVRQLGSDEILTQLAEEAAELAQAALKYRRAVTQWNPTPVDPWDAEENLNEEIADVMLCLLAAGFDVDAWAWESRAVEKLHRWAERLRAARERTGGDEG